MRFEFNRRWWWNFCIMVLQTLNFVLLLPDVQRDPWFRSFM
jgi:hypothetical protein